MLYVCDLHVHIGAAGNGKPVKVTASRELTFANIAAECVSRKGVDLVGIVDCASPAVIGDIGQLVDAGEMTQLEGGGLRYRDQVTVLLGSEIETREPGGGVAAPRPHPGGSHQPGNPYPARQPQGEAFALSPPPQAP